MQDEATYPNGTHICEVEIDEATGETGVVKYTIVDDFGATVNPLLLAGQVHGGVVQAIGQCIMEETVYDGDGQLISASFMDYRMPRAQDFPNFHFETRNVPSTTNALGIKGAGEAGTIGATPCVMNAIGDAIYRSHGIEHVDMPVTPLCHVESVARRAKQGRVNNGSCLAAGEGLSPILSHGGADFRLRGSAANSLNLIRLVPAEGMGWCCAKPKSMERKSQIASRSFVPGDRMSIASPIQLPNFYR